MACEFVFLNKVKMVHIFIKYSLDLYPSVAWGTFWIKYMQQKKYWVRMF